MKYLSPMRLQPEWVESIEREINFLFGSIIYEPLMEILRENNMELMNAADPVIDGLLKGKIYFQGGFFYGSFNAAISKRFKQLGAKYSLSKRAWKLDAIPAPIQIAIAQYDSKLKQVVSKLIETLDSMHVETRALGSSISARYYQTIGDMNDAFEKTVRHISIAPKLTPAMRKIISDTWAKNLELYITDWAKENILKLRQQVNQHVMKGGRAEPLARMIQANYDVSRNKAKFLARQETSLLMSKMRQQRYESIGVTKYKWSGADDERERPDHRRLNNKIFSWDNPPITNRETGARNNPGEDFGCRCVAIPIVEGFNDGR